MPVDRGGAGGAGYRLAPGSWRKLLRDDCDRQCRPDARLYDDPDFAELKAAGAARSAEMFEERRVAGPRSWCRPRMSRAATSRGRRTG
jgi:hypothetical protein